MSDVRQRPAAAVAVRGKVKRPLAWLPWVALLLAGLLALGAFVVARNSADEGDDPGIDLEDDPAAAAVLEGHPVVVSL